MKQLLSFPEDLELQLADRVGMKGRVNNNFINIRRA